MVRSTQSASNSTSIIQSHNEYVIKGESNFQVENDISLEKSGLVFLLFIWLFSKIVEGFLLENQKWKNLNFFSIIFSQDVAWESKNACYS